MTLAFVFPGQGSQYVGMGQELVAAVPEAAAVFDAADAALEFGLSELVAAGPEDALGRTEVTQPAILTASVAAWRAYCAAGGPMPAAMAGHSLGEYAALVAAGSIEFTDAVRLVRERGRLMQGAAPEGAGAMAAVLGLERDAVDALCAEVTRDPGHRVQTANINAPGQVVIAGHAGAVEAAIEAAKAAGARRAVALNVSVAAHSALMAPAVEAFSQLLEGTTIRAPAVPVLHNATGASATEPGAIRDALARQLTAPVDWVSTVATLGREFDVTTVVECGPSNVLAGLGKRIDKGIPVLPLMRPEELIAVKEALS